jgi:hypothetical protein
MQATGQGIRLEVPFVVRVFSLLISVLGYVLIFLFVPERAFILALIFWSTVQCRSIFYAPEITVYDNGIETNRLGIRHFTYWREIDYFRQGELHSQIYPQGINKYVRRFIYSNLLINKWRRNYTEAIDIIKRNVEEAQEALPERVYD